MRFGKILAVLATLGAMVPQMAYASCTQASLQGVWKAYSAGVDNGVSYWTSCFVSINASGFIANTTCVNSFNSVGNLTQARIVLSNPSQCAYNGRFTFAGEQNILRNMTLARDRYTANGVGVFQGGSFVFSMTKI
jgi:hypothetical protein